MIGRVTRHLPAAMLNLGVGLFVVSVVKSLIDAEPYMSGLLLAPLLVVCYFAQRYIRRSFSNVRFAPLGLYALAWIGFTVLRGYADDLGFPNQGELAAGIDRALAFGVTPTERLQAWLFVPGKISKVDQLAVFVHASYFAVPHVLAFALWLRGTERTQQLFANYLRTTVLVLGLGLVLYVLLPTSPPWLQTGDNGALDVQRIIWAAEADGSVENGQVYGVVRDPNPIAAMPSLHTAITVLAAWVAWRVHRNVGILFALYAAAMGLALVYLAEHFVVDVVAGIALTAGVVWWAAYRSPASRTVGSRLWNRRRAGGEPSALPGYAQRQPVRTPQESD